MAVFYIYIGKYNGQVWEIWKHRNIDFSNLHRCIQAFVGLIYKLADDFVFKQEYRNRHPGKKYDQGYQEIKKNFPEAFQSLKNALQKYATTIKPKKAEGILTQIPDLFGIIFSCGFCTIAILFYLCSP